MPLFTFGTHIVNKTAEYPDLTGVIREKYTPGHNPYV